MQITNEIPLGSIDGLNKNYTVQSSIDYITNIIVDGLEYSTGYSHDGMVVSLSDAPTLSITISYLPL